MRKYLVFPGWIISRNDFDRHWVSRYDLMHLYGVRPDECVVIDELREDEYNRDPGVFGGLVELRPRYDGNYSL